MSNIVDVPNVDKDERIGGAFNHLFLLMQRTDSLCSDDVLWDFKDVTFFHPFFLAPLIIYKQRSEKNINCINVNNSVLSYLNKICFDAPLIAKAEENIGEMLSSYTAKTYLPMCKFELRKGNIDGLQSAFQNIIRAQSNADHRIVTPLSYLFGELVDNMNEHSLGKFGYIYAQYLKNEDCINIVLADDGITIFGSYVKANKFQHLIQGDESIALKLATEGKSTKNLPDAENRGYGISSSKKMLVEGLHGSFFILSGGAFHRHDEGGSSFVRLPENIYWNGTIVLMRIPTKVPAEFKYYNYTR